MTLLVGLRSAVPRTWTEADIVAFEAKHPVGTRARLALARCSTPRSDGRMKYPVERVIDAQAIHGYAATREAAMAAFAKSWRRE